MPKELPSRKRKVDDNASQSIVHFFNKNRAVSTEVSQSATTTTCDSVYDRVTLPTSTVVSVEIHEQPTEANDTNKNICIRKNRAVGLSSKSSQSATTTTCWDLIDDIVTLPTDSEDILETHSETNVEEPSLCVITEATSANMISAEALSTDTETSVRKEGDTTSNTLIQRKRRDLCGLSVPNDLSGKIEDGPTQPHLHKFPASTFGRQNRYFSKSYYKHNFIEYSIDRDAVFCFACRMFPSSVGEPTFVCEGYNNWKDIGEALTKHEASAGHLSASARWLAYKNSHSTSCSVLSELKKHDASNIQQNRSAVSTLAKIAIVCARQDIAFRGNNENSNKVDNNGNQGNFLEILNLLKSESGSVKSNFARLPKNANYCAKDSQNELIHCAAEVCRERIIKEIKEAGIFSLIADESRDVSKVEQLSICVRYVHGYDVKERFLDFVALTSDLSAAALAKAISDTLTMHGLSLNECVSQCYDGASVMSGSMNGVQAQIRELSQTPCLYVHCYAHKMNLVLVDTCVSIKCIGDVIGILQAIHNFITVSSIRHNKFVEIQRERGENVMELPLQSHTRWTCKLKAIQTAKLRFFAVKETLQYFAENGKPLERAEVKGLLIQFMTPSTVFVLHLLDEVLTLCGIVSAYCQDAQASMSIACQLITSTSESLLQLRNDVSFERIYQTIKTFCIEMGTELPDIQGNMFHQPNETPSKVLAVKQRQRRVGSIPSHFRDSIIASTLGHTDIILDNTTNSSSFDNNIQSLQLSLRRDMFSVLDQLIAELDRRFTANSPLLQGCDATNPSCTLFLDVNCMKQLAEAYSSIGIDTDKLEPQCAVAKNMLELSNDKPKTSTETLRVLHHMKSAFPDLYRFFQLVHTIPVSSAGSERSFSTMKRVKTFLRSSMSDGRLANLCILSIERQVSGELLQNPEPVVSKFADKGNRKLQLK